MKYVLAISLLTSISLSLLISLPTLAQSPEFTKTHQDYLQNYNSYRDSHNKYVSARGEYLTYKTLTSQTKALETTRVMLQKRADTLKSYLLTLKIRLNETTGVIDYPQSQAFIKLDIEINWLDGHKNSIAGAGTIDDLLKVSSELEKKYPKDELLIYQTLGLITSGRENSLRNKTNSQIDKISEKIGQMRNEGENVEKLERWLEEAKKKVNLSNEKQVLAEGKINEISDTDSNKVRDFDEAQVIFSESHQALKEASNFLSEIIEEIKYD